MQHPPGDERERESDRDNAMDEDCSEAMIDKGQDTFSLQEGHGS